MNFSNLQEFQNRCALALCNIHNPQHRDHLHKMIVKMKSLEDRAPFMGAYSLLYNHSTADYNEGREWKTTHKLTVEELLDFFRYIDENWTNILGKNATDCKIKIAFRNLKNDAFLFDAFISICLQDPYYSALLNSLQIHEYSRRSNPRFSQISKEDLKTINTIYTQAYELLNNESLQSAAYALKNNLGAKYIISCMTPSDNILLLAVASIKLKNENDSHSSRIYPNPGLKVDLEFPHFADDVFGNFEL